jgi:GntR family phosphonate transport system transcriptional regulator
MYPPESKLPTETDLAGRFGVHRNTVRQAVAALSADGLVISRQGSGTFVAPHALLVHRIGLRTRLSHSLGDRRAAVSRVLRAATVQTPPKEVADRLRLDGAALRVEILSLVDDVPVARATSWFDASRVPELDRRLTELGSITIALAAVGIDDYVRAWSAVSARVATSAEAEDLQVATGSVVLVVRSVDALVDGTPLQYGVTQFRADRVELDVQHDEFDEESST